MKQLLLILLLGTIVINGEAQEGGQNVVPHFYGWQLSVQMAVLKPETFSVQSFDENFTLGSSKRISYLGSVLLTYNINENFGIKAGIQESYYRSQMSLSHSGNYLFWDVQYPVLAFPLIGEFRMPLFEDYLFWNFQAGFNYSLMLTDRWDRNMGVVYQVFSDNFFPNFQAATGLYLSLPNRNLLQFNLLSNFDLSGGLNGEFITGNRIGTSNLRLHYLGIGVAYVFTQKVW